MKNQLTFWEFSDKNAERCEDKFHDIAAWSPSDWCCAVAGEVGELCNKIKKKYLRGEDVDMEDIADEIADSFMYLDLLSTSLGLDLASCIVDKYNKDCDRFGCPDAKINIDKR